MHYLVPDKALKGQTSIRFHVISRSKCCLEPVEIKTCYSIHKMLFFATHTIFIMQKRKELFIFPNPVTKLLFLTFFLLGLHNYVFIHISWYLLFQSFGIKNGLVLFLWIIFNTVFYFCQGIARLEHKPLRRYSGKVVENTSPVEFWAKSSRGQCACKESYCLLIGADTHSARVRNSFIFMHM